MEGIKDPVAREARVQMIKTYGQTPKQLFFEPHPMVEKDLSNETWSAQPPKVLESVNGLRWGKYLGSPAQSTAPKIVMRSNEAGVDKLYSLDSNEVG